jgi:hypothetical protein
MTKIIEALMIDLRIIRNHYNQPFKDDLSFLITHAISNEAILTNEQLVQRSQKSIYQTIKQIECCVEKTWQVSSEDAMSQLLHRLKLVYKKVRLIASKAGAEKQRVPVVQYQRFNARKAPEGPLYFIALIHSLLRFEEDKHLRAHHKPIAGFG